jgi:hypothetical protein
MIDAANGASPPWPSTREMARSSINFDCSILTSTSDASYRSKTSNQEKNSIQDITVMNEYVLVSRLFHIFTDLKVFWKSVHEIFSVTY